MKRYLCWLLLPIFIVCSSEAQNKVAPDTAMEVGIGEQLPDLAILNVLNSEQRSIYTKDFRGKMLILDFWATWCSPCVALMPKMDSIQKAMRDEIQILPVTYQSKAEVERFLKKSPKFEGISLPFVYADETLRQYFPHKELPHYVWIDSTGKVIAITGHNQITTDTIKLMLSKSKASLPVKKDEFKPYDREKAVLFQELDYHEKDVQFQSLFTGFKEGVNTRMDITRYESGKVRKITILNGYLQFLFRIGWSDETRFFTNSRILIESRDSLRLISRESGEKFIAWLKDHSWTYELIVPEHLSDSAFVIMRTDMERFFPQYSVGIEKRQRKCLVLERTSAIDKIGSAGGEPKSSFDALGISMVNRSITLLVSQLNYFLQDRKMPVVDATGYSGTVDLFLDSPITNLVSLRKALQPYDLDLVEKDYEIDMLVIKDK